MTACKDIMGWRDGSLKLVIFMTGSGLHYALDGQLGGIIIPNDERCHLKEETENSDFYSHYYHEWYERETGK